jgi:DNA-binding transcriptional ArsR family regulator
MNILHSAGLVDRRKQGRWAYYRLTEAPLDDPAGAALHWARSALGNDPTIVDDDARLDRLRHRDLVELCACYRT